MINKKNVDTFLFGSKSQYNDLCYRVVSELKIKYLYIKRVYVRAEFPDIDTEYEKYLLQKYEKTFYSEGARGAGRAVYIKRNCEMIDASKFCVMYYNENYVSANIRGKSGTKIAYEYAKRKGKIIINTIDF